MSQIQTSDVYIDVQLTDVSVRFTNESYLADQILPIVNVKKKSGIYYVYDKENLKKVNSRRISGSRANRVEYGLTKATYGPLIEHSLEEGIDWDTIQEAVDPLDPSIDAVNNLSERLLIEKESDLVTLLNTTTVVTQYTTLSGANQWSNYLTSSPFEDVETGRLTVQKNSLKKPNTIVMGLDVWSSIKNHPDFLERIKYTQLATLSTDLLKDLFPGIEKVMIGEAMYNSANEGAADSMATIWGKDFYIAYITPQPGIRTVSLGYTLTLEGGRYVDAWTEQQVKQDFVRVNDYYQQKVVAKECIYRIAAAIA